MCVLVAQSRLTLCDPMDCSLLGSSVHGILWSGLPFPPSGNRPYPGIKIASPVALVLADEFFTTELPGKPTVCLKVKVLLSCV